MEMPKKGNPLLNSRQFDAIGDSSFRQVGQRETVLAAVGRSDHYRPGSALAISVGGTKLGRYGVLGHGINKN